MSGIGEFGDGGEAEIGVGGEPGPAVADLGGVDVGAEAVADAAGGQGEEGAVAAAVVEHPAGRRAQEPQARLEARAVAPGDQAALAADLLAVVVPFGDGIHGAISRTRTVPDSM